ncbi:hypothetical protein GU927_005735 [Rhodobacteraceae bacterium HSP-20]|uniref:Uncharacterized protein n=1 Tax=Paragemmobacter amnigenus TaxID=2852097 RepID=A0ABS6J197_9RHOB|nr:hypothetical protein [Rhodobacter amnigenus]MBU9697345.1 hypothetical protein [Rhodobacter amnigenus]MBV4388572.1 hypothetical protein [Rhodobacter amnigenus]
MSIPALIALACLALAALLRGPLRIIPLVVAVPLLLALTGSFLRTEFGLSIAAALLGSALLLMILLGLPALAVRILRRKTRAATEQRNRRLAAIRRSQG